MIKNVKIDAIETVEYDDDVFNLELESSSDDDDLYWCDATSGIFTHNCFPKDLAAIVFLSKTLGVDTKVMQAVQSKNLDLVPPQHRDWEQMTGRAVSTRKK